MGFDAELRQTRNAYVYVHGGAYSERDLLGVAYVIEQATLLRQPPSEVNPSMYRCADTVPPPPYAERGHCNPDFDTLMRLVGTAPTLPFALETESVERLQARLTSGSLTSEALTKAYLARIAYVNAEGPAIQAVRDINMGAIREARKLDTLRKARGDAVGPLYGIPVLLSDAIDVAGMPTTGGSIALQDSVPRKDSDLVANLKAAGAIILGKTNVTELNGFFDSNMPEGYSSLGAQVLLPSDTDKTPAGSSAGSAAATATGLAALSIGLETSPDTAQLILPAAVAGIVGLKLTVGMISTAGIMPVASSQDSVGPMTRTVYDAAIAFDVMTGAFPSFVTSLTPNALSGKRVAVIDEDEVTYQEAVSTLISVGATPVLVSIDELDLPDVVLAEFKRDLNAYLSNMRGRGPGSLQEIIDYNIANPVEGLKYQQRQLLEAQAVNLSDLAIASAYAADLAAGKSASQELIDTILSNGTPDDPSDDIDVIMVPPGDDLIGVADVAGYPLLTVPAGEGVEQQGRNPIGVIFAAGAYEEGMLLAAGYAFEQGSVYTRRAPSITNPSMFRCVPGSAFFTAELCHPGDRLYSPE
jgi:Asp-tRNA(Asn)/Glu-tRNA(Gln) amidotransferase A subunit family amidase